MTREEALAQGVIAEAVARVFEVDPHQFSSRPCETCLAVSALLDRPFGCLKVAADRRATGGSGS